jgi:hypothetical protein
VNRAGIGVLDAVECVLFIERREDAIAVIKGIVQVVDQLRLVRAGSGPIFAVGRLPAFEFVEEGELRSLHA